MEAPLLVAWQGFFAWGSRGLDCNHGLVQGACHEGSMECESIQCKQRWMVYLELIPALCCWAQLDGYWQQGRLQLLVEDLKPDGGKGG